MAKSKDVLHKLREIERNDSISNRVFNLEARRSLRDFDLRCKRKYQKLQNNLEKNQLIIIGYLLADHTRDKLARTL